MKDRKLMVEVTDEEYELLKKGIKLSDMKTEDLIYELISRSDEKVVLSRGVLVGTPDMKGCIHIADGDFDFKFTSNRHVRVSVLPTTIDPLAEGIRDKLFDRIDKDIADKGPGGKKPW